MEALKAEIERKKRQMQETSLIHVSGSFLYFHILYGFLFELGIKIDDVLSLIVFNENKLLVWHFLHALK